MYHTLQTSVKTTNRDLAHRDRNHTTRKAKATIGARLAFLADFW